MTRPRFHDSELSRRIDEVILAHLETGEPTADEVSAEVLERYGARVLDLPYNRQELIINLASAGALFKKLLESSEGYAGDVPIIHQAVAVKAAIDALDGAFQESGDPN